MWSALRASPLVQVNAKVTVKKRRRLLPKTLTYGVLTVILALISTNGAALTSPYVRGPSSKEPRSSQNHGQIRRTMLLQIVAYGEFDRGFDCESPEWVAHSLPDPKRGGSG